MSTKKKAQPPIVPMRRKICILGTTPSRTMAPFGDDSWEFWTIGPGGKDNNRWDALFELHGPQTWPEGFKQYIEEISTVQPESRLIDGRPIPKRVYTMAQMPGWTSNVAFPRAHIIQKYGRMWLSSQISWALALALEEGATDIGLYGIDLESGEEYEAQFEGCRFFIDLARLAGINIHVPPHCALLRDPEPYPERWESIPALYVQSKVQYLEALLPERQHFLSHSIAEANNFDGQIAALKWVLDTKPTEETITAKHKELQDIVPQINGRSSQAMADCHRVEGELEFAKHWLRMFVHKGGDRKIDLLSPWS